jgi:hypothetical protein
VLEVEQRERSGEVVRVMALVRSAATDDEALRAFRDAAIDAGATVSPQLVRGAST